MHGKLLTGGQILVTRKRQKIRKLSRL